MTTLIKNGLVYDGSGAPGVKTDILINGKKIVRIGANAQKYDVAIDATNAIIAPGFIDINAVSDHSPAFFEEQFQNRFIEDGVTTVIGGNCGASLAPIGNAPDVGVNVSWRTVGEFLNTLRRRKLSVNFGTLVGHTTVRESLLGETCRDLTDRGIKTLEHIIARSLDEGAFGVSVGFENRCSAQTPFYELKKVAAIAAEKKKIFAMHPRNAPDALAASIEEIIDIIHDTQANTEINNLQPLLSFAKSYREAQERIEKSAATEHIHIDCAPCASRLVSLDTFLPHWARQEHKKTVLAHVQDRHLEKRLLEHLKHVPIHALIIENVPDALKFLSGKSVKAFAESFHLTPSRAMLELMKLSHLDATLFSKDVDENIMLKEYLASPYTIVASHGAYSPMHKSGNQRHTLFQNFLAEAEKKYDMPFEKAIEKITSLPAKKYWIEKRGLLKEGYYADIVIIKENKINDVWVNGEIAYAEGKQTRISSGMVLKSARNT